MVAGHIPRESVFIPFDQGFKFLYRTSYEPPGTIDASSDVRRLDDGLRKRDGWMTVRVNVWVGQCVGDS
jgi:hypothetical protein